MSLVVRGVVRDGMIVPEQPLPEGAQVRITLANDPLVPPELKGELDAWALGSAQSLDSVERLADAGSTDAPR